MTLSEAMGIAATAWCKPATRYKEMDSDLAMEFALILLAYTEMLAMSESAAVHRNMQIESALQSFCQEVGVYPTDSHTGG